MFDAVPIVLLVEIPGGSAVAEVELVDLGRLTFIQVLCSENCSVFIAARRVARLCVIGHITMALCMFLFVLLHKDIVIASHAVRDHTAGRVLEPLLLSLSFEFLVHDAIEVKIEELLVGREEFESGASVDQLESIELQDIIVLALNFVHELGSLGLY